MVIEKIIPPTTTPTIPVMIATSKKNFWRVIKIKSFEAILNSIAC